MYKCTTVSAQYQSLNDRRTDGRMDRDSMSLSRVRMLWHATK